MRDFLRRLQRSSGKLGRYFLSVIAAAIALTIVVVIATWMLTGATVVVFGVAAYAYTRIDAYFGLTEQQLMIVSQISTVMVLLSLMACLLFATIAVLYNRIR